jgi:hypothetical protein
MTAIEPQRLERIGRPVSPAPEAEPDLANYVTGIADGNLASPVKLRDFLFGLGVLYRLPKRTKTVTVARKPWYARVRLPVRQIAYALSPVAVALVAWSGWRQLSGETMPLPAQGLWATDDGRYKGRSFWLNAENVAFQNGSLASQFTVHPIKRVSTRQAADTLLLSVDYETGGKRATLALAFVDGPSAEMRLVNQPRVRWTRAGNAPTVR